MFVPVGKTLGVTPSPIPIGHLFFIPSNLQKTVGPDPRHYYSTTVSRFYLTVMIYHSFGIWYCSSHGDMTTAPGLRNMIDSWAGVSKKGYLKYTNVDLYNKRALAIVLEWAK